MQTHQVSSQGCHQGWCIRNRMILLFQLVSWTKAACNELQQPGSSCEEDRGVTGASWQVPTGYKIAWSLFYAFSFVFRWRCLPASSQYQWWRLFGFIQSASEQQSSLRQWYNRLLACVTNSWRGDFGKVLLRIQCFGDTGVAFREGRPRAALCKVRIHWCSAMADQELSFWFFFF